MNLLSLIIIWIFRIGVFYLAYELFSDGSRFDIMISFMLIFTLIIQFKGASRKQTGVVLSSGAILLVSYLLFIGVYFMNIWEDAGHIRFLSSIYSALVVVFCLWFFLFKQFLLLNHE